MIDRAGAHHVDAAPRRDLLDAPPLRAVADEQQAHVLDPGERGDGLVDRVEAAEAPDPADDEPVSQPQPRPHSLRRSAPGAKISVSTPVGVTTTRAGSTPIRTTSSTTASVPHATTSARRTWPRSPRALERAPQPGRCTPQTPACQTSVAGTNTPTGRRSSDASSKPATWKSSCRCQTNARSWSRHGPSRVDPEGSGRRSSRADPSAQSSPRRGGDSATGRRPPRSGSTRGTPRRRASSGVRIPEGVTIHGRADDPRRRRSPIPPCSRTRRRDPVGRR